MSVEPGATFDDRLRDLAFEYAALKGAKEGVERERDSLARRLTIRFQTQAAAVRLLGYALQLRQHGERAPGGNETWAAFDKEAEMFLRLHSGASEAEHLRPWSPMPGPGPSGHVSLADAVGQALGSASMSWSNIVKAGEFDSTWCREVYEGLMAYLSDWADEVRREANEATAAKMLAAENWEPLADPGLAP